MAKREKLLRVWHDNIPNLIQEKINEGWSLQLAMKKARIDGKMTYPWVRQYPSFALMVEEYKHKVRHKQKYRVNGR